MNIQQRRLDKGWSQEYLAQVSGLSVRTVQRIEGGQRAGLETLKSLAAAFETDVADLAQEPKPMIKNNPEKSKSKSQTRDDQQALEYVENLKGFHLNWIMAAILIPCLYIFNLYDSSEYPWILWVIGGWGLGIALHAVVVFGQYKLLGRKWERQALDKYRNRQV
ncbi:MAG: 2TM domain-containing protein [Sneathiella sp.]|uniref:2TM domain-containing protein n=1 Tax=Sneathiella sp. TaxID=1964365 RepID=UPI003001C8D5